MDGVEVSVVCPAYNEEETIEDTVKIVVQTLSDFLPPRSYEVIIAEDGCDDRTPEIATRLSEETVRFVTSTATSGLVAAEHCRTHLSKLAEMS